MDEASEAEARAFAKTFRTLIDWAMANAETERNEVVSLIADFIGGDSDQHSVVARTVPVFEQVNLQTALNAWLQEPGREVAVHGFSSPLMHIPVTLQQIVAGNPMGLVTLSAPPFIDLANGPVTTLACLQRGLLLVHDAAGRYVLMVRGPDEREPGLNLEIAGLPVEAAQAILARLDALRRDLNVYRGHLIDVGTSPTGALELGFATLPTTEREAVILPASVIERVERHALGIAAHRAALLSAGQHLKRGLLLFGPPGTGKTHTTRYLLGRMEGYTRFMLTGRTLAMIGEVAELARRLEPAVVVLEDVDLVAEERSRGGDSNPLLFDLLDAMDGAAPDADLLFLLTTNRADLLEPALAARPGRVDVAVEIALPDAAARLRLLRLYARSLPLRLSEEETATVVQRTDGVTASFLKELLRRAVLAALDDGESGAITATHVTRALDDLLDSSQRVTRSLLGVSAS